MDGCMSCQLIRRRDDGTAPPWDAIVRTEGWDLAHAYDASLEGWLVLVARRHLTALSQMTDAEAQELGLLIARVSAALEAATGGERTYIAQFAEHPDHRHVHVHVIPRAADLPGDQRGPRIFSRLGVNDTERVSETLMNNLAARLRQSPALAALCRAEIGE
jgi:diadenosine tetraphosphate (Ap4A) HIT family hydrolase